MRPFQSWRKALWKSYCLASLVADGQRAGQIIRKHSGPSNLLRAMSAVDRSIPTQGTEPGMQVYRRSLRLPDTWVQRVRDWYPEQVTAAQVCADPGGYILCMSFFDIIELVDIDPASGVWIYSSSEPHNEEQQFELRRLQNWLDYFHLTPLGLTDAPSPRPGHILDRSVDQRFAQCLE